MASSDGLLLVVQAGSATVASTPIPITPTFSPPSDSALDFSSPVDQAPGDSQPPNAMYWDAPRFASPVVSGSHLTPYPPGRCLYRGAQCMLLLFVGTALGDRLDGSLTQHCSYYPGRSVHPGGGRLPESCKLLVFLL